MSETAAPDAPVTGATVDMDKLSAELTAAGLRVDPSYGFLWAYYENDDDPNNNFRVFFADDEQATIRAEPRGWGVNLYHPVAMAVLDIIRSRTAMVPPGMVIAPAGDCLTAEDRAAIGRMVRSTAAGKLAQALQRSGHSCVEGSPLWEAAEEELAALDAITDDDVARFRALAAGGTE